jgi:hypothetical protein
LHAKVNLGNFATLIKWAESNAEQKYQTLHTGHDSEPLKCSSSNKQTKQTNTNEHINSFHWGSQKNECRNTKVYAKFPYSPLGHSRASGTGFRH